MEKDPFDDIESSEGPQPPKGGSKPPPRGGIGIRRKRKTHEQDIREYAENGDPERNGSSKEPKRKPADLNAYTRKEWKKMGYWPIRLECWQLQDEKVVKRDFLGCFDYLMVKGSETVAVQITTKSNKSSHVRKFVDDKPCRDNELTQYEAVKRWIQGNRAVLMLCDQPGGKGTRWQHELVEVDLEFIEEARGRKRAC